MRKPILVPNLGLPGMVLSVWYVKPGETVYAGDRLVELLLDSATFDVTASESGTLVDQCAWPEDVIVPGQIVGFVDVNGD
jgi:pyruvate/2-oxoglutarate dehydrogenase complex dihydrolipoamide acyltransferase (E2) component